MAGARGARRSRCRSRRRRRPSRRLPAPAATYQSVEFGSGQNVYTTATAPAHDAGVSGLLGARLQVDRRRPDRGSPASSRCPAARAPTTRSTRRRRGPNYSRPNLSVDPGRGPAEPIACTSWRSTRRGPPPATPTPPCVPTMPPKRCFPVKAAVSNDGGQTFARRVNVSPLATQHDRGAIQARGQPRPLRHRLVAHVRARGAAAGRPLDRRRPDVGRAGRHRPRRQHRHVARDARPAGDRRQGASSTASYPRMAGNPVTGRAVRRLQPGLDRSDAPAGGFQGADHFISPDAAVWFQRSKDFGATWSTPKRISDRTSVPGTQIVQTRHPSVSVSPNGRVNVVWHDRRHWYQGPGERTCTHSHIYCEDARLSDTYYSYSTDGGDDVLAEHPHHRPVLQHRRRLRHAPVGLLELRSAVGDRRRRPRARRLDGLARGQLGHRQPGHVPREGDFNSTGAPATSSTSPARSPGRSRCRSSATEAEARAR